MTQRSHRSFFAAFGVAALLVASAASAALGQASNASVSFVGSGAGLRIEQKTSELKVSEENGKVHFVVPLTNLVDNLTAVRAKHARGYLETDKFPNAELIVERAALKFPADGQETTGPANGTLIIHGVSKPVAVSYRAKRSGNAYDLSGSMRININEFGIKIPSYLGVTMKPEVDIALTARVQD